MFLFLISYSKTHALKYFYQMTCVVEVNSSDETLANDKAN